MLTEPHKKLDTIHFITQNIHKSLNATSVDDPLGAALTSDEKVIVTAHGAKFILKKYSGAANVGSVDEPYHTIMVKPDDGLATIEVNGTQFIIKNNHFF